MTSRKTAYLDTEFTDLSADPKLISLALVVHQGPEFYVELIDNWEESDCADFVLETVLPQLDPDTHGRTTARARAELHEHLKALGSVEILSDAPQWDWPLLRWLARPAGLPATVTAGRIDLDELADGELDVEQPHHALDDARLLAKLCAVKSSRPSWNGAAK